MIVIYIVAIIKSRLPTVFISILAHIDLPVTWSASAASTAFTISLKTCFRFLSVAQKRLSLYVATKTSRIPRNLNFLGETAFLGGIFCLEYPSRRSEKVNCHFINYRLSFHKLQIVISQTADFHFANYRFSFRKLQIFISFRFAPFRFANYSKPLKLYIFQLKRMFRVS